MRRLIGLKPLTGTYLKAGDSGDRCVVGFDVWGTLLDLERVLKAIARSVAYATGLDLDIATRNVFKAHEEAKSVRRKNPEMPVNELFNVSRRLLAMAFNTSTGEVDQLIRGAFETAGTDILYGDVIEALEALNHAGVETGIIGNVLFWPSTYTRLLLRKLGISRYFKQCVFSDEVGISKPDRRIFLLFAGRMGVDPSRFIYVGDNVVEDIGGALSSGGVGVLISRRSTEKKYVPELRVALISNLRDLVEVYDIFCGLRLD
ncbi:MAG: HAD family hydrolase [Desulfurococcaceae archaeon]